jgi:hypothetical protein
VHPEVAAAASGKEKPRPRVLDEMPPMTAPSEVAEVGQGLYWDLMTFGLFVSNSDVKLTNAGSLPKRTTDRLGKVMANTWTYTELSSSKPELAAYLLEMSGLVLIHGSVFKTSDDWDEWVSSDLVSEAITVLESWTKSAALPAIVHRIPAMASVDLATTTVRQHLQKWLLELQPGVWYSCVHLARRVASRSPFFLRSEREITKRLGPAGVTDLYDSWGSQEGVDIVRTLASMPLQTGVVDAGWYHRRDRMSLPDVFRLTEFGARVLGAYQARVGSAGDKAAGARQKSPNIVLEAGGAADQKVLVVQPNFEVLLLDFYPPAAYELGRFADPRGFDRVGRFMLTSESVRAAAGRGVTFDHMRATLARFTSQPIPQNVEYQLRDWVGSIQRVRFERTTLVELDSPEGVERLLENKSFRAKVRRRISPTQLLIAASEDIPAIAKTVEPSGFVWERPKDWEMQEEQVYNGITRVLRRFETKKYR